MASFKPTLDTTIFQSSTALENTLSGLLNEFASSEGTVFAQKPLAELSKSDAVHLIDALYSPDERFAEGFYKYRVDVLKHPEELAWHNTLEELEHYKAQLKANLADDGMITLGEITADGRYHPVGMVGFRPLAEHPRGQELLTVIDTLKPAQRYAGNKGMVHSFSLLKDFRSLEMLKYVFLSIGLRALQAHLAHVFFFFSDYRLKTVYQRYGLDFPEDLKFPSSQHVIGCYSLTEANQNRMAAAIEMLTQSST
ncbi:MAG: hypothetical protein QE263_05145 [Vampirovibrionales bacterium]|nr:hypothetical protein [Vampirovibrionales bacterium]